jgi:predicted RNase H-like nuclease
MVAYCRFLRLSAMISRRLMMAAKKNQEISGKQLQKLGALLADVSRATELRPQAEQHNYKEAQRSVLVAKRKAELRAQQPRIA